ncbi:TOBE domain-containing protein, partial [Enterobacter sp. R1(2018)]|uniref:TOBE domain-containing protein n=1 Tax=Enterobacter sp. R1(2018) TaxID=2447891 RepID=UPI00217CC439
MLENRQQISLPIASHGDGQPVRLGIRPEHIQLTELAHADVEGEVLFVEHMGNETLLYVNSGYGSEPLVMRHTERLEIKPDQRIGLRLPPENCYLFDSEGRAFIRI